MGPIRLDSKIMGTMKTWGNNYDSEEGCGHNPEADKLDSKVTGKDITINVMSKMDVSHAKPGSENPGFDKGFWGKAEPQKDTVEGFVLTRKLKD